MTFDRDEYKGSLVHRQAETRYPCPHCDQSLQEFQYRLYSLKLDNCPNGHGFWLDAGEDARVMGIMAARTAQETGRYPPEIMVIADLHVLHERHAIPGQ